MKKLAFIIFIFVSTSLIYSATINVPADYSTIQAAINAAVDGDIIQIAAGTYTETLSIGKSLTFIGSGPASLPTTIITSTASPFISLTVTGKSYTFQNLIIHGNVTNLGIRAGSSISINSLTMQDVIARNCKVALYFSEGSGVVINNLYFNNLTLMDNTHIGAYIGRSVMSGIVTNSTFTHNGFTDVDAAGWQKVGLQFVDFYGTVAPSVVVTNCNFDDNGAGASTIEKTGLSFYTALNTLVGTDLLSVSSCSFSNHTQYAVRIKNGYNVGNTATVNGTFTNNYLDIWFNNIIGTTSSTTLVRRTFTGTKNVGPGPTYDYNTIQAAISAAVDGDIINVAAGTYAEVGQIVINKALSIVGENKLTTIINPTANTGSSGDARGWWLVNPGFEFNLSNVTLDGTGWQIMQCIRSSGIGTINNVNLTQIKYPGYQGVGVVAFDDITVSNCTFTQIGRIGIIFFGTNVSIGLATQNNYTGKGVGDWLDYGVELGGGAVATIANNTFSNCLGIASDGSGSAGVLATTYFGNGTAGLVNDNIFNNNSVGIYVGYDATDVSTVVAHNNSFTNCEYGVTSTAPPVNAENNWWGTVVQSQIQAMINGTVDFDPWIGKTLAYNAYLSSSTIAAAGVIYPNTNWGVTGYEGTLGDDWDFTAPVEFYIVPEVGSVFGASDITIQWDNTMFSYVGVNFTGGIYSSVPSIYDSLRNGNQLTINASRLDNTNFYITPGQYIAKLQLNLLKPGFGPINFSALNFRAFDGLGGQLGVVVTGNNAKVKSYLGDVASLTSTSTGDGLVDFQDLSPWSVSYWSGVGGTGMANYKVKYDVGPTSTGNVYGIPAVNGQIQFEDLVIFSMSYGLSAGNIYPKIEAEPIEPVDLQLGEPIVAGNQTRIPLFISGGVQNVRAMSLTFAGQFGKLISIEKGSLLNEFTNPVMLMSNTDGNLVYVDLAVFGAEEVGINQEGEVFTLVFEGNTEINLNSADVRNILNSPMAVNISGTEGLVPTEFALMQNYPNPFNPSTTINYNLPNQAMVEISIYNALGERVAMLVNEIKEAGRHTVEFNASGYSSGIYFYQIKANDFVSVKKMILMK